MIRERIGDVAIAMEDDDGQYVYDLYTAVEGDAGTDRNGTYGAIPTVRANTLHYT